MSVAELEHRICGIPCIIEVTHFSSVKGSFSYDAPSDMDYHGYTECEYEVLDRRGRPAPWLQKKVTDAIDMEIQLRISEVLCED